MEFPAKNFKPKRDRFAKSRGGQSRFLYISCANCEEPAMVYQKDGKGRLQRSYVDRIVWPPELVERLADVKSSTVKEAGALACGSCENILGTPMVYEREDRPAFRMIHGASHIYRSPEQAQARTQPPREQF